MEPLRNPDEKILCPYNPAHHILKTRMESHLYKCRKSFNGPMVLVECEFNNCHRVPEPELQYHHNICVDRKKIEQSILLEDCNSLEDPLMPLPRARVPVDDSWDESPHIPSYNPQKYCEENAVLRRLDSAPAAERKKFRNSERTRIQSLMENKQTQSTYKNARQPTASTREVGERQNGLPPVPQIKKVTDERVPDDIASMLDKLKTAPKRAVIPNN